MEVNFGTVTGTPKPLSLKTANAVYVGQIILGDGSSNRAYIKRISPEKIAGPGWDKHADEFFKKMSSMEGVRLPGERRHKNRLDKGPRKINEELINKIKSLS